MLFNSIEFLIFLPIVSILFYLLPHKFRWIHLLLASCTFYMFFIPEYILILFVTIVIDYYGGLWIEQSDDERKRKLYLYISIGSTCLVLFIFKYIHFFYGNLFIQTKLLEARHANAFSNIILPIGLSFPTFQSLSYVIEVSRKNQKAEKNFGISSLSVMFYPQLVTGPIERPQNLLTQLRQKQNFEYANIANGLRLILWGLFIKMVIADNLAPYVDQIYEKPSEHNSISILTGLVFYSFQIYCDFFGYSTIAVGCAKVIGFNLIDNFKNPYLATNIKDFWQRWHISLSTWFRDYVYFPLGGNRVKFPRWTLNIMIVFVLSGFWHGANWTFLLWGFAHGAVYIIEELITRKFPVKKFSNQFVEILATGLRILKTFTIVTGIWILFRAPNLQSVRNILGSLKNNFHVKDNFHVDMKVWILLGVFILLDVVLYKSRFDKWFGAQNGAVRWATYAVMLFVIFVFANVENFPFIYFQF